MIYITIFSFTTFLCWLLQKKIKKINGIFAFFSLIIILTLTLFGGLRSIDVGTDNRTYQIFFNAATECSSYSSALNRLMKPQGQEPLFVLLLFTVSRFTDSYVGVSLSAAFITSLFVYLAAIKYRNIIPIWLFMLSYLFIQYCYSWNIVRQGIALAIFLFATWYLQEEKWIKYLFLVIVASLFHYSALITIVFIPLSYLLKSKYKFAWLFTLVVLALSIIFYRKTLFDFFVVEFSFIGKFSKYIQNDGFLFSLRETVVRIPLFILGTLFYKQFNYSFKNYSFFYAMILFDLIIVQLYEDVGSAFRLSLYFNNIQIILLSRFPFLFRNEYRRYSYLLIFSYIIVYWLIFYVLNNFNFMRPVYPYHFFYGG